MTILELRKKTGLSRTDFCKMLNISYKTVEKWETNSNQCKPYMVRALYYQLLYKKLISKDTDFENEEKTEN